MSSFAIASTRTMTMRQKYRDCYHGRTPKIHWRRDVTFTHSKRLRVAASCESHDVEIWYWYIRIWKRLKYRHQQRIVDNYNDIGRVALISRDAFTNLAGFRFGGSLGRGMVSGIIFFGNPLANLLGMRFNAKICTVSFLYLSVVKTQSKTYQKWNKTYRVRHICRSATLEIHCLSSPLEMWSDSKIAS